MPNDPLLSAYRARDSLFSSPTSQLHARGVLREVSTAADHGLVDAAALALRQAACDAGRLPLLGAVPFDPSEPSRLWIPMQAAFANGGARHRGAGAGHAATAPSTIRVEPYPEPARYLRNVASSLERILDGGLSKVVMSRSVRINAQIDVPQLLQRLLARTSDGYTFAMDLAGAGGPRACLVGSSPELLLSRRGTRVVSNPLAGSIARSEDPIEDQRRARRLLRSGKDRHEHALVVDAVGAALSPFCRQLKVPVAPSLLATPTMWHLSSRVHGELRDTSTSSLQLALALHPTPAVCGHPTASARQLIREIEGYERGLFTGLVGWCDGDGDGEWAVTIRCALIDDDSATVYAGAGVVEGSRPDAELAETTAKLATMLGAMGLGAALEGRA